MSFSWDAQDHIGAEFASARLGERCDGDADGGPVEDALDDRGSEEVQRVQDAEAIAGAEKLAQIGLGRQHQIVAFIQLAVAVDAERRIDQQIIPDDTILIIRGRVTDLERNFIEDIVADNDPLTLRSASHQNSFS